jgi:hypothetical protein
MCPTIAAAQYSRAIPEPRPFTGELLRLDEFNLEVIQAGVVQAEAPFQGAIRDAPLVLQEGDSLLQDIGKFHLASSTRAWGVTRCYPLRAVAHSLGDGSMVRHGRKESRGRTCKVRSMMERIPSRVLSFCAKAGMMLTEVLYGPGPGVSQSAVKGREHPVLTGDEPEPEPRQRSTYDL